MTEAAKTPRRHVCRPGMQQRLMRTNLLDRVQRLGAMSDAAVVTVSRKEDLVRNLTFAIHQQRLTGALGRLAGLQVTPASRSTDQVVTVMAHSQHSKALVALRAVVTRDPWRMVIPPKIELKRYESAEKATKGGRG